MSATSSPSTSTGANPPIHIIYASHDLEIVSDGQGTNKPVVRKRAILAALQKASKSVDTVTFQPLTDPAPNLDPAIRVHDKCLVDLFATGWQRWKELGENRDLYYSLGGRVDPTNWEELVPSQIAPRDAFQRPGASLHGQVSFYAQDRMTPITQHTSSILHHDLAVTLEAVKQIQSGQRKQVYAFTTEPGHHSGPQSYGGYCFINQAALAASLLSDTLGKVAILDVDYHAGNGSASIFASSDQVFVASLHADPDLEYPYNFGWEDQKGVGKGLGSTMNVPLPKGTTWSQYQPHLQRALDEIKKFGAKALVVSLGVDTIAHDPEAAPLAGFLLYPNDYSEMGAAIRSLGLPTIFVQEGGYKLDEVGEVVRHVLVGQLPEEVKQAK